MKESTNLTNNNLCLYFQFQRLIIEEKETEKNAVDTATLMGGPKGKKGIILQKIHNFKNFFKMFISKIVFFFLNIF